MTLLRRQRLHGINLFQRRGDIMHVLPTRGESVVGAKPQSEAEPQEQVNLGWSGRKKQLEKKRLKNCIIASLSSSFVAFANKVSQFVIVILTIGTSAVSPKWKVDFSSAATSLWKSTWWDASPGQCHVMGACRLKGELQYYFSRRNTAKHYQALHCQRLPQSRESSK